MQSIRVEYVIFTGWHAAMYLLGPSAAMDKWLPGHTTRRDLIGEIADALNEKGIRLIIYAHPNDGHDLKPEEQTRVGFLRVPKGLRHCRCRSTTTSERGVRRTRRAVREKKNVLGFWWDSWRGNGGCLDAPRLRRTVLAAMPQAIILSNNPDRAIVDFPSLERYDNCSADVIDNLQVRSDNQTFRS